MVDGLIAMMDSKEHGPINLGNSEEFTIRQLASLTIKFVDSKLKTVFRLLPEDDQKNDGQVLL